MTTTKPSSREHARGAHALLSRCQLLRFDLNLAAKLNLRERARAPLQVPPAALLTKLPKLLAKLNPREHAGGARAPLKVPPTALT